MMIERRFSAMRMAFVAVLLAMTMSACHDDGLTKEQRALRKAAVKSYEYLQEGKYEKFVGEIAYADSMSDDYRAQMVDLIKEYTALQEMQHGKLVMVEAVSDTISDNLAQVFLQISYADSTSEEVGVPMVKVDDDWKMQ